MTTLLRKFLRWLLKDELELIRTEAVRTARAVADKQTAEVLRKLQAIQAIDASFHDSGKIIVICRVGRADYVKIIDCKREWRLDEYRQLIKHLEFMYGAQPAYFDVPRGLEPEAFRW